MPITLLCLVKGNTTTSAFAVDIDREKLVSHLKEAIKAKKHKTFHDVEADELKLWKVTIPGDQDDPLSNLSLQDSDELLAINEIGEYWTEKPPKKRIHVLVEPPESTTTSSQEVKELLDRIASLEEKLSKNEYAFDVIVKPKQKANKWTANIEQVGLGDLKDHIRELYKPPALENDGAVLNFVNDGDRYYPRNDGSFREMLRSLVSKNNLALAPTAKFTVFIETPSKPFNSWTFPKVCELYGLSDDPSPSIDVYPIFKCGCVNMKDGKYKEALRKLFDELETRIATTPIDVSYEATKSIYSFTYLASASFPFKSQVKIVPEKLVEGKNGRGNLDYGIESRTTGRTIGLIEVKKDDFKQGFAQATVQMESSLARKRKANEIDDEYGLDKVWGIVTDAEKWYFMECSQENEGKVSFKLSKPLTVAYEDGDMKEKAEKVLGHIIWLLEEAQKPVKALEESREIKRVRSGELPKVTDLEGKTN